MKSRRMTAVVGLTLAAALTFSATGCKKDETGTGQNGPGTAATATADPAAMLANSAVALNKDSFKINCDLSIGTVTGSMDTPNKTGVMTMKISTGGTTMDMDMRLLGTDLYMKMNTAGKSVPGFDSSKWIHLDMTRLPANNSLGFKPGEMDPAGAAKFLNAVATAESGANGTIKGTMDLTKAVGAAGVDKNSLSLLGEDAKKVPFEATLDDQGRLTKLVVDMPKMGTVDAYKAVTTYSDFGTTVTVAKPRASEIVEAPEMLYGSFTA